MSRNLAKRSGEVVAALEPEAMRAYLLEHPLSRGGRLWCDRVLEGVDRNDRTAMNLFGNAMRWTGATVNIGAIFLERFNARSEEELGRLVESGRRLEQLKGDASLSLEAYRDEAVELLRLVLREHPEWRQEIGKALGLTATESPNGHQTR